MLPGGKSRGTKFTAPVGPFINRFEIYNCQLKNSTKCEKYICMLAAGWQTNLPGFQGARSKVKVVAFRGRY